MEPLQIVLITLRVLVGLAVIYLAMIGFILDLSVPAQPRGGSAVEGTVRREGVVRWIVVVVQDLEYATLIAVLSV